MSSEPGSHFLINHLCPMDHDRHYYTRAVANTDLSVPRPNFEMCKTVGPPF